MKAQTSTEFLITFGVLFLIFLSAVFLLKERSASLTQENEYKELATVAATIDEQVQTASKVHDGYTSSFDLPLAIAGNSYTITSQGNEVVIHGTQQYVLYLSTNVTASIVPGKNMISKRNGTITIVAG